MNNKSRHSRRLTKCWEAGYALALKGHPLDHPDAPARGLENRAWEMGWRAGRKEWRHLQGVAVGFVNTSIHEP